MSRRMRNPCTHESFDPPRITSNNNRALSLSRSKPGPISTLKSPLMDFSRFLPHMTKCLFSCFFCSWRTKVYSKVNCYFHLFHLGTADSCIVTSVSNTALFPNSTSTGLTSSPLSSAACGKCYLEGEGVPIYWDDKNGSYTAETVHITIIDQNGINVTQSHTVTANYTATYVDSSNNATSTYQYQDFATNGVTTVYNQTMSVILWKGCTASDTR